MGDRHHKRVGQHVHAYPLDATTGAAEMTRDYTEYAFNHCRPWQAREYIIVNGYALVYTVSVREGLVVRFPGGKSATPDQLHKAGYKVRYPAKVRDE